MLLVRIPAGRPTKKDFVMTKAGIFAFAAICMASGASAQDTTFANQSAAQDSVNALQRQIREDGRRDVATFGNAGRRTGWTGNFALRGAMSRGNTHSADLGLGARFSYFDGVNGHRFNGSYSIAEKDGVRTKDSLVLGYDYTRDLNANLYAFGKVNLTYDRFSAYRSDAFVGAGLGFRVVNNATTQWSVQAGPGYREARFNDGTVAFSTGAAVVSSYFKTKLADNMSLTNDTDVLWSRQNTRVINDLGVNINMTDALALRTSLTTQYNTTPRAGFKKDDHTLGVSLVYSFN